MPFVSDNFKEIKEWRNRLSNVGKDVEINFGLTGYKNKHIDADYTSPLDTIVNKQDTNMNLSGRKRGR